MPRRSTKVGLTPRLGQAPQCTLCKLCGSARMQQHITFHQLCGDAAGGTESMVEAALACKCHPRLARSQRTRPAKQKIYRYHNETFALRGRDYRMQTRSDTHPATLTDTVRTSMCTRFSFLYLRALVRRVYIRSNSDHLAPSKICARGDLY